MKMTDDGLKITPCCTNATYCTAIIDISLLSLQARLVMGMMGLAGNEYSSDSFIYLVDMTVLLLILHIGGKEGAQGIFMYA